MCLPGCLFLYLPFVVGVCVVDDGGGSGGFDICGWGTVSGGGGARGGYGGEGGGMVEVVFEIVGVI